MDTPVARPATVKPGGRSGWWFWRAGYVLVVGAWLVWVVVATDFSRLAGASWSDGAAPVFILAWLLLPIGLGLLWRFSLGCGSRVWLPWPLTARVQALAWAGRYLPGKAGMWIAKLSLVGRSGLDWRVLGHSLLVEQGVFVIAGGLLAALLLPWPNRVLGHGMDSGWAEVLALAQASPVLVLSLVVIVVLTAISVLIWLGRRGGLRLSAPVWLALLVGHGALHVVLGLGLYPLLAAVLPDAAAALGPWGTVGALAFANVAGILAVIAPAGLGVREAGLAALLLAWASWPDALAFAALARLLSVLADLAFVVFAGIAGRLMADSDPANRFD